MEVVVTTGAISHAKLQSNDHHQQTDTQFFTGRMPFLSPNQQCQSTEGKNITLHGLAYPKLTWGLPTLSQTTNSSWLPRGRFAMPLISPLMPVPQCWRTHLLNACIVIAISGWLFYAGLCRYLLQIDWWNAKNAIVSITRLNLIDFLSTVDQWHLRFPRYFCAFYNMLHYLVFLVDFDNLVQKNSRKKIYFGLLLLKCVLIHIRIELIKFDF